MTEIWNDLASIKIEWIVAISTIVTALTGVILAFFTWRLALLTRELATETRRTREAGERADVQVSVGPHERDVNLIALTVANVGKGTAHDLRLSVEPDAFEERDGKKEPLKLRISTFLPEARVVHYVGLYPSMTEKTVKGRVHYQDPLGEHTTSFEQDVSGWLSLMVPGDQPAYEAAEALGKIAATVDRWTNDRRLGVNVFSQADRDKASRAHATWLAERNRSVAVPPQDTVE